MHALSLFVAAVAAAAAAAFVVRSPSQSSLSFLVMGDWGGSDHVPFTTPQEVETAKGMGKLASQLGAKMAVALGDNFYDEGVTSVESPRFRNTFENVFSAPSLQADAGFRFQVVAG